MGGYELIRSEKNILIGCAEDGPMSCWFPQTLNEENEKDVYDEMIGYLEETGN